MPEVCTGWVACVRDEYGQKNKEPDSALLIQSRECSDSKLHSDITSFKFSDLPKNVILPEYMAVFHFSHDISSFDKKIVSYRILDLEKCQ